MLFRQNLSGNHESPLVSAQDGSHQGDYRYDRLAAADIPLQQTVHFIRFAQIPAYFVDDLLLPIRKFERQSRYESLELVHVIKDRNASVIRFAAPLQHLQAHLVKEKLLIDDLPSRLLGFFIIFGKVHRPDGFPVGHQVISLLQMLRKYLGNDRGIKFDRLFDQIQDGLLFDRLVDMINGGIIILSVRTAEDLHPCQSLACAFPFTENRNLILKHDFLFQVRLIKEGNRYDGIFDG